MIAQTSVEILGPGAVGCLFAARLAQRYPVTLLGREKILERVKRGGITLLSGDLDRAHLDAESLSLVNIDALPPPPTGARMIFVTLKATALRETLPKLSSWLLSDPAPSLVFCQNGLGIVETTLPLLPEPARASWARASLWLGTTLENGGAGLTAKLNGLSRVELAGPAAQKACDILNSVGINATLTGDAKVQEWRKALSNLIINPICAVHDTPNGAIVSDPRVHATAERVGSEVLAVAAAEGVALGPEDLKRTWKLAEITGRNLNSMLLDLRAGRETEIEFLTGSLVRAARRHGIDVPENERILGAIAARSAKIS